MLPVTTRFVETTQKIIISARLSSHAAVNPLSYLSAVFYPLKFSKQWSMARLGVIPLLNRNLGLAG